MATDKRHLTFLRLHERAIRAKAELGAIEAELAAFFQPYFKEEVFVLYQDGDGFCVCYEGTDATQAPFNIPVVEAMQAITGDKF